MKVKIGPYLNWWGPYQILGLLQYVGISEERTDDWADRCPEWFTYICQWIHNKRKRTIKIKIDRYDVWSMDGTLALIIVPMLKLLKEDTHGSPIMEVMSQTSNSAQRCFDFYGEDDDLAFDAGHEQWIHILDEIIWSFQQSMDDNWEEQFINGYKYDWEGMRKYQERIEKGFKLFGIHYQSFWD